MNTSLADRMASDLKDAIRSGDTVSRDVIRYAQAAIKNQEIDVQRPLTDEEVEGLLQRQVKQRQDAIELFEKGGREDLVRKETSEIDVLKRYLPEQLDDEELQKLILETADELGASSMADMRTLMPALIERTNGKADTGRLSMLATAELRKRSES